jgi:hypothetical protein
MIVYKIAALKNWYGWIPIAQVGEVARRAGILETFDKSVLAELDGMSDEDARAFLGMDEDPDAGEDESPESYVYARLEPLYPPDWHGLCGARALEAAARRARDLARMLGSIYAEPYGPDVRFAPLPGIAGGRAAFMLGWSEHDDDGRSDDRHSILAAPWALPWLEAGGGVIDSIDDGNLAEMQAAERLGMGLSAAMRDFGHIEAGVINAEARQSGIDGPALRRAAGFFGLDWYLRGLLGCRGTDSARQQYRERCHGVEKAESRLLQ